MVNMMILNYCKKSSLYFRLRNEKKALASPSSQYMSGPKKFLFCCFAGFSLTVIVRDNASDLLCWPRT